MKSPLRIAVAQFPVSPDIARNARYIRTQVETAAARGANVIQFPETALSGYAPKHCESIANYAWDALATHTMQILELASRHQIWIVLGSMRRVGQELPTSCLHIISDRGEIVGTYDKQRLYAHEKSVFSPGNESCVVCINGYKCGFLICYDNCFPQLYEKYRDAEVGLLFHSFYNSANSRASSIKDLMLANLLVRAADNQMWIAASNCSKRYSPLSACIVRPDGTSIRARRHVTSLVLDDYPNHSLGWTYNNRIA
jgi:predicted amidohydrolase